MIEGKQSSCLYIWDGRTMLGCRDGLVNEPHEHYAASLIIALKGRVTIVHEDQRDAHEAVLLAPNYHHSLQGEGVPLIILHIDPDSREYGEVCQLLEGESIKSLALFRFRKEEHELAAFLEGDMDCNQAQALYFKLLSKLAGHLMEPIVLDGRVRKVLRLIREKVPGNPRTEELAEAVGLSQDRLMHLFKEQLGMPMRRYLQWVRLRMAVLSLCDGGSLTQAAHLAGFSDSAHLSRTFKSAFGLTPSQVFGDSSFIQAQFCEL